MKEFHVKRYKWAVYTRMENYSDEPTKLLGRYKRKWRARLAAWWFQFRTKPQGVAWLREEFGILWTRDRKML